MTAWYSRARFSLSDSTSWPLEIGGTAPAGACLLATAVSFACLSAISPPEEQDTSALCWTARLQRCRLLMSEHRSGGACPNRPDRAPCLESRPDMAGIPAAGETVERKR